jgi:hypothetical protein
MSGLTSAKVPRAHWKLFLIAIEVIVDGKTNLLHVIPAVIATSGFTCLLNSWQQQANENTNNRNHNEELNKRESFSL